MNDQNFVNQKLEFIEELILHTDAHVFLTGKAGTGKTTFLKSLPMKTAKRMVVVAPTGVAAINADGQTIHSFFQLPFGPQVPENPQSPPTGNSFQSRALASQFQKIRKKKLNLMRALDLLIIDEISMVRADVLDAVDAVLRRARRSTKPFGGVQLLMIGDVHQLAPVAKPEEWEVLSPYYDTTYFFGSRVLQNTPYLCVELEHIYRQHDTDFIRILNKVRDNRMDAECVRVLNSRYLPAFTPNDDDGYITLTTHNYQADSINESKLKALGGKSLFFDADINGIFPESIYPTKETLELKVGAQVMFIKNDPEPEKAYFNGKIGRLIDYDEKEGTVEVLCGSERISVPKIRWSNMDYVLNEETQEVEEVEIGSFTQIPLRLAWAVTIHKSQGLTFDKLIVDAGKAFAHGQVYVALSRCTSLEGLVLKTKITANALVSDYKVDCFVGQMPEREPSKEKLDNLRQKFQLENLLELIDFQNIYKSFSKIVGIVLASKKLFEESLIQHLLSRLDQIQHELCDVGKKFTNQLLAHQQDNPVCAENQPLQSRLKKASAYFKEHLDAAVSGIFDLPFKTDNKAVNEQVTEALKSLYTEVSIKESCLDACTEGFSAEQYLRTKAAAAMKAEKGENQPVNIKDDMMEKSTLYKALVAWRAAKAEEEDVPPSQIAPNQTLKGIASEKPVTLNSLKKVNGMGTKRVKRYGEEIVTIVRKYADNPTDMPNDTYVQPTKKKGQTYQTTKEMLDKGMSVEAIAEERKMAVSTIYGHLSRLVEEGFFDAARFVDKDKYNTITEYFESVEDTSLSSAREVLGDEYEFWELRTVLAELQRKRGG